MLCQVVVILNVGSSDSSVCNTDFLRVLKLSKCFDTFSKHTESALFWSELLYHCLGIVLSQHFNNKYRQKATKSGRVKISGLLVSEEVPSFAPLTVNSPLAKGIEIHCRVIQKNQKLADHYK